MYVDRNMVEDPYFRLTAEGNRGVYVPASSINTTNGAANWTNSRKTKQIGRVLEMNMKEKTILIRLCWTELIVIIKTGR
ncbi:Uncharacterised protein [Sphingobacterium multivorum]|uniref:Uncharacterized protein n=1 Tax=Sphingobacterium multivorum TaxID=28454 RepID=A0A2X2J4X0_SPHMU|nr:hypothetical protein [Sphingobacterium multivorum]SPZ87361.1 Uncharacterised protein [Sphingobacterium multivorum]